MIFLWDYILTFGMEVDLVWKSKGNFLKGLYLFQRYLPFTDILLIFVTCQSDIFPIFLFTLFFCNSNGANFKGNRVSEDILR
jgi:hypothetical protein